MIMKEVYLYGASGHGKVIKEIVEANGGNVAAFIDDNPDLNEIVGLPVKHSSEGCSRVIVSIGAGSVVINDIPDGVVAYGNPCRVVE